jgi:hypothetical protein
VCPEQEEKPYSLNKRDVLVYTLNRSAFHKSICSGLGITLNENALDGIPGVFRVGDYTPTAGYSFPVYLTFKDNPEELLESVEKITLLGQEPFVLFIPTRNQLTPRIEDQLQRSGSICLVLREEFSIQGIGESLLLRKLILGIQAQVRGKSLTGLIIICDALIRPASTHKNPTGKPGSCNLRSACNRPHGKHRECRRAHFR